MELLTTLLLASHIVKTTPLYRDPNPIFPLRKEEFEGTLYQPQSTFGCAPGYERVLRGDFTLWCAKDFQQLGWH